MQDFGSTRASLRLWLWLAAGLAGLPPAQAQGVPFSLPTAGCPMAHCDPRMSDQVGRALPSTVQLVRLDTAPVGGAGHGCVSNLRTVACTYRGEPLLQSNLVVYDADGQRIWEDHGQLGINA